MTTPVRIIDVSSWNVGDILAIDHDIRIPVIRANDGNYNDPEFQGRLAAVKHGCDIGRFVCFGVYGVYEDPWQTTAKTTQAAIGVPHRRMFIMDDEESWNGRYSNDHSGNANAMRYVFIRWLWQHDSAFARVTDKLIHWRNPKRVIHYGNYWDLIKLVPTLAGNVIVADYSNNSDDFVAKEFPKRVIARQYTSNATVEGFAKPVDMSRALIAKTPQDFARQVGCITRKEWRALNKKC